MKMSKQEIVKTLIEIADLLEISEANTYEIMAHRNAARSLDEWDGDLQTAVAESKLCDIPSVGKGISQVITDLANTGSSPVLKSAKAAVPAELPSLLRIRGLGPKRVRTLWLELEIESPDDLRKAADSGALVKLRGFGAKTVERIVAGLDRLDGPAPTFAKPKQAAAVPVAEPASGRIWAGTSGFSYPQWKGTFYPEDAKTADLLQLYAAQLPTVEINNTFYRFPTSKVIAQWEAQTPEHFRFAIKANRRITHTQRLGADAESTIVDFVNRCAELGRRLGCILFQLPPNFARDDAKLNFLLNTLPTGPRYAIEFRHESWYDDDVKAKLSDRGVAFVASESEKTPAIRHATGDFVYVRLRQDAYSDEQLADWDEWFTELRSQKRDVWVFLKHDEEGVNPQVVLSRWAVQDSAERELLAEQLAKPSAKPKQRRRKSG